MKALTLYQPWASLVAVGAKTIETRSWSTKYRGPLAIHAAVKMPRLPKFKPGEPGPADIAAHELDDPERPGAKLCWCGHGALQCLRYGLCVLPRGEVVATCTLVDVLPTDTMTEHFRWIVTDDKTARTELLNGACWISDQAVEAGPWDLRTNRPLGDFTPGRFAWLLADTTPVLPPVAAKGHQQLWEWDGA